VATGDNRIVLYNTPGTETAEGRISEDDAFKSAAIASVPEPIYDICFSPDGSAIALLLADGTLSLRSTKKPTEVLLERRIGGDARFVEDPSQIVFLYGENRFPRFVAFSQRQGTFIELYDLADLSEPCFRFELRAPASFFRGGEQGDLHSLFGHMTYQPSVETLLVSHSVRASVFALHLNFQDDESRDYSADVEYFRRLLQGSGGQRAKRVQADYVVEIPAPEYVVGFAADEMTIPQEISLFPVHPERINEVHVDKNVFLPPPSLLLSETMPSAGIERMAEETATAAVSTSDVPQHPPVTSTLPPPAAKTVDVSSTTVVETKKVKGKTSAKPLNAGAVQSADKDANLDAASVGADGGEATQSLSAVLAKEIKKLEDGLYKRMSTLLQKEIERQGSSSSSSSDLGRIQSDQSIFYGNRTKARGRPREPPGGRDGSTGDGAQDGVQDAYDEHGAEAREHDSGGDQEFGYSEHLQDRC
jgi:hypothetical protein